jgi:Tol biopolymer transport system component
MASVSSDGVPGDDDSFSADPSSNGDLVAFASSAPNLVDPPAVPPANYDLDGLYLRDTVTGLTSRVDDFPSDVVLAGRDSYDLSADGSWIVYAELEEVGAAPSFVDEVFLENLGTHQRQLISSVPAPDEADASIVAVAISADGSEVAFAGDSNDQQNGWHQSIWIYDPATGTLRDALQFVNGSANVFWALGDLSMSADGTTIAFSAANQNLLADPPAQWALPGDAQSFVMSTAPGALPAEVMAPGGAVPSAGSELTEHSLSGDGRYLGFQSVSTNWTAVKPVKREWDAYVEDLVTGKVTRLTVGQDGQSVSGFFDGISDDGESVVFESTAGGLVPNDTNGVSDVFLWHRSTSAVTRLSVGPDGEQLDDASTAGLLAGDGEHVTFVSGSGDVVYGATGLPRQQVFETTLSGASLPNLATTARTNEVELAWSNPRSNFAGVVVRGARGNHAPSCPTCGFAVYRGTRHHASSRHLRNGNIYSYAVFTKNAHGVVISRKTGGARPHLQRSAALGAASFAGRSGKGWGRAHPSTIVNGKEPTGRVSQIRWQHWGAQTSRGSGSTSLARPGGGYYAKHVRIELKAVSLGSCRQDGLPAYTRLYVREPSKPGGKLSRWHPWSHDSTARICRGGS